MTPAIILSVASIAVGAAGAWTVQSWRYDARIADIERTHAAAVTQAQATHIKALENAREQTAKHQQQAHQAAQDAASRVAAADLDLRRNRTELERLRDAIRARPATACPVPDTAAAARVEPADTIGELFEECGEALTELARATQGHAIDVVRIKKAWPK